MTKKKVTPKEMTDEEIKKSVESTMKKMENDKRGKVSPKVVKGKTKTSGTVSKMSPIFLETHKGIEKDERGKYEHSKGIRKPRIILPPGITVTGYHDGKTIEVTTKELTDEETKEKRVFYMYNGKPFKSLSKISSLVCGHPVSGPNFFGLGWGNGKYRLGNVTNEKVVNTYLIKK